MTCFWMFRESSWVRGNFSLWIRTDSLTLSFSLSGSVTEGSPVLGREISVVSLEGKFEFRSR